MSGELKYFKVAICGIAAVMNEAFLVILLQFHSWHEITTIGISCLYTNCGSITGHSNNTTDVVIFYIRMCTTIDKCHVEVD